MNEFQDIDVIVQFADVLDRLDITYAIGGSIASSFYGKIRFTQDADIAIEPFENKANDFFELLKTDFYISKQAMLEALRQKTSFNLIHLKTAYKIDVFVCSREGFSSELFNRKKNLKIDESAERLFSVVAPEDIILLKLKWYLDTECISNRQWEDVLGVIEMQKEKLDVDYLNKWAGDLGVRDLLQKAISDQS